MTQSWPQTWERWQAALAARGATRQTLGIGLPASAADVAAAEDRLGRALPTALRETLLGFASHVHISWSLKAGPAEPRALRTLSRWGELEWNCATLERSRSDTDDPSDDIQMYGEEGAKRLVEAIVFQEIPNGDALAVDARTGAVVYLDHEGGDSDGAMLAPNFNEFITRYSAIGCPGPEWWMLAPFCTDDGIDPQIPIAQEWRAWAGIEF